jgi:hypothetical protein
MEKRLKIYVYREGRKPLVHDGPCKDIYSTEGVFIHELKRPGNAFATRDPSAAHVFFLPFSVSKMVSYLYEPDSLDMGPLLRFADDYVRMIASRYPFWNRSSGSDHFMLACHDWVSKLRFPLDLTLLCFASFGMAIVARIRRFLTCLGLA